MTSVDVFMATPNGSVRVGEAHFTRQRGKVSTTFLYDTEYLRSGNPAIDPAIPLVSGAQYQSGLVRAFADSAPDRWGRSLLDKAVGSSARSAERTPRRLDEVDYLLGVSDDTRQGALRYRIRGHTEFLGAGAHVPPLLELPSLLRATEEVVSDVDSQRAVKRLFDTGTTGLGGARPRQQYGSTTVHSPWRSSRIHMTTGISWRGRRPRSISWRLQASGSPIAD